MKFFEDGGGRDGGGRHLGFVRTVNSAVRSAIPEYPTLEPNMKWIGRPVAEIWPFEFFQDGGGRHLGFVRITNSAVRSAVPEYPTLEPNMKCIGSPVAEIRPFAYGGDIWNPHFGGRGGRRGSAMAPLERAMVVSYRLSIVTVALSVSSQPQLAIECLRRSNQQGWVTLCPNLGMFPLDQTRHVGVAKSEHPRLTNGEIIFEEFQPM